MCESCEDMRVTFTGVSFFTCSFFRLQILFLVITTRSIEEILATVFDI